MGSPSVSASRAAGLTGLNHLACLSHRLMYTGAHRYRHMHAVHTEARRKAFPGADITGSWEPPDVGAGPSTGAAHSLIPSPVSQTFQYRVI